MTVLARTARPIPPRGSFEKWATPTDMNSLTADHRSDNIIIVPHPAPPGIVSPTVPAEGGNMTPVNVTTTGRPAARLGEGDTKVARPAVI